MTKALRRSTLITCSALALLITLTTTAGAIGSIGGSPSTREHTRDVDPPWNNAIEVPGTAGLNAGGNSELDAVSCAGQSECSGGGTYLDAAGTQQAYVVSETGGAWGSAYEVPGLSSINFGDADFNAISCSSPGDCSAAGDYTDATKDHQAWVATEIKGAWTSAIPVPALAGLNAGGIATGLTIACLAPGECDVGGFYTNATQQQVPFSAQENEGAWDDATPTALPAGAALAPSSTSTFTSVSCWGQNSCVGVGFFDASTSELDAFTSFTSLSASTNTTVETPIGVAGLDSGTSPAPASVSCDSGGQCTAAGFYIDAKGVVQPLLVTSATPGLSSPVEVPISLSAIAGTGGLFTSISCPSKGDCSAVGNFVDASGVQQGFTLEEFAGTWGTPSVVNQEDRFGPDSQLNSVSCTGVDSCLTGGISGDADSTTSQAITSTVLEFLGSTVTPTWQGAIEAPGTASLDYDADANVLTTSCSVDGFCAAGGYYLDRNDNFQSYVATIVLTKLPTPMKISVSVRKIERVGNSYRSSFTFVATGLKNATGTVDFFRTGIPLCTAKVVGGQATCSVTKTFARTRVTVYALYSGDSLYAPAYGSRMVIIKG